MSFVLIFVSGLIEKAHASSGPTDSISADAFVASEAGAAFQSGDYERALAEIDSLTEKHPGDPLLIRYRAIALDRLGRSDEAIATFKDLLIDYPDHIPTRFFLGEAYARVGERDLAVEQWKWVALNGDGTPYESWAHSALTITPTVKFTQEEGAAAPSVKRWHIYGRYGYEYDSNVILKPNDGSLASTRDPNAGRQTIDFALRYRAFSRRDMAVDLHYAMRQTLHDDSLDEFNFHSEEFSINARKRLQIRNQDVTVGLRYDFLIGFLGEDLFSVRNRWRLSADTRFTERSRTVFYDRITISNFAQDGFDRDLVGRDGFSNDVGVTHYIYSNDFRKYIYLNQEFNSSHTEGDNFDRVGTYSRIGAHVPLLERLDWDGSVGLRLRFYHNFHAFSTRDASRRRDVNWDIYNALTFHLTEHIGLRGFYRYISGDNQNNFFDYNRHVGGVHVIYSQSI